MEEEMSNSKITKHKTPSSNIAGHDCTICLKSNMTLSGLKIHLLTHSGERPFICDVCDKRFTCSSNLKKHQRIHTKDYIYKCEICGKSCSDPSNMKKHMTVHSARKAYTCPICGKNYSYAQSLRQHMDDIHAGNGEKKRKSKKKGVFPCPDCGKIFGYSWRCSLHQARVHAQNKPYKCPECGKCFARETILNKHLQTHEKPHSCTECYKKFSFRDQLKKHYRIHSGEKPYNCEECLKSFTQRGSLTEHMRIHSGLKPYSCETCGQKFSSNSSLKRHSRRVNACSQPETNIDGEIPSVASNKRMIYIYNQTLDLTKYRSSMSLDDDRITRRDNYTEINHEITPSLSMVPTNQQVPEEMTITSTDDGHQYSPYNRLTAVPHTRTPPRSLSHQTVFNHMVPYRNNTTTVISANASHYRQLYGELPTGVVTMVSPRHEIPVYNLPVSHQTPPIYESGDKSMVPADIKPCLLADGTIAKEPTEDGHCTTPVGIHQPMVDASYPITNKNGHISVIMSPRHHHKPEKIPAAKYISVITSGKEAQKKALFENKKSHIDQMISKLRNKVKAEEAQMMEENTVIKPMLIVNG